MNREIKDFLQNVQTILSFDFTIAWKEKALFNNFFYHGSFNKVLMLALISLDVYYTKQFLK